MFLQSLRSNALFCRSFINVTIFLFESSHYSLIQIKSQKHNQADRHEQKEIDVNMYLYIWDNNQMGSLSLNFKTKVRSVEVLNFNDRPAMRFLCCLYDTKLVFVCFREILEIIFDSRILTVISLLGLYF